MTLPTLPRGWHITQIGLSLEMDCAGRDDSCPSIQMVTDDDGAGAYLRIQMAGEALFEPGDLPKLAALAEALMALQDANAEPAA